MREVNVAGILFVSLALALSATAAERRDIKITTSQDQITKSPDPKVIKVSAERFAFSPSEITVEKGTVIEFHLSSEDTDHGFRIIDTDIDVAIPKRRRGETIVRYTADKAGRFVIECSRPCGAGHTAMRATLIVK
jgi:cytochrome c oxidase subunit 2